MIRESFYKYDQYNLEQNVLIVVNKAILHKSLRKFSWTRYESYIYMHLTNESQQNIK